jgi:hypothetical protein
LRVLLNGVQIHGIASLGSKRPLFTDIIGCTGIGTASASAFGSYTLNSSAMLNGNDVLSITSLGVAQCCHGVFIDINVPTEERLNSHMDGAVLNTDAANATPANPTFAAIVIRAAGR